MMASWVEMFVGADIRVRGILGAPGRGAPAELSYRVENNHGFDAGPFATIEAALEAAIRLAPTVRTA